MSETPDWVRVEFKLPAAVVTLVEGLADVTKTPVGALATVVFLQGLAEQMAVNGCADTAEDLSCLCRVIMDRCPDAHWQQAFSEYVPVPSAAPSRN